MQEPDDRNEFSGDIAVVGMAGRFPGAPSIREFWRNLCAGTESVAFFDDSELAAAGVAESEYTRPDYVKAGARTEGIEEFDAEFFGYTPREAMIMDPQHRVFLETAWEALEHAGYSPDRLGAGVGVFGGAGTSAYLGNVFANLDRGATIGASNVGLGNELGFLTTRISYKLNLRGPSVPVHTACSSSLVAVHLAGQSLMNHECDMALAGGVAFKVAPGVGYRAQEGGILSPDGHCRPFDALSNGTVFNNGAGVVVLKRLADALSSNDTVYAVIKGSAVNNDGSVKASFTAPSVGGQAGVVLEALAVAGVDADTISYVEAHGSGTAIGDAIEIEALTRAFSELGGSAARCAIGSVKSNIGHLDAAAGIVGLLKTVLALYHRTLPPTVHFQAPNPGIDFAQTPFHVQAELAPWESPDGPRRAGVSAFGFGGTNAHVVLEQALDTVVPHSDRASHLLVLSARTPSALQEVTERLAAHLRRESPSLADVAYTLAEGRQAFAHRRMLVAADVESAVKALESLDPAVVSTAETPAEPPTVAFRLVGADLSGADEMAGLLRSWGISPVEHADQDTVVLDISAGDLADAQRTLGRLWLAGVVPDWTAYHRGERLRRVALPTYPFERKRYWLDPSSEPAVPGDGPHPLLDELLVHGMDEVVFRTTFAVDRHWVLSEHLMMSEAIVPGTTYLEMARAAGEVYLGVPVTTVNDVEFYVPLVVSADEARTAHTTVRRTDSGELDFTVASRDPGHGGGWTVHARGRLGADPVAAPETSTVEELRARCDRAAVDVGKLQAEHRVMEFGSRWRDSLGTVDVGVRAALGHLALPTRYQAETARYVLHPALLDLATGFHRWAMLDADADQASVRAHQDFYLPLAYDSLTVHRPIPAQCVSFIQPTAGFKQTDDIRKADVLVLDPDGRVVLDIRGFTAKRVGNPRRTVRDAKSGSVYHTVRWVEAPNADGRTKAVGRALVVGRSSLAHAVAASLTREGIEAELADPDTDWSSLPGPLPTDIVHVADDIAEKYTVDAQRRLVDRGVMSLFRLVHALGGRQSQPRRITVVARNVHSVTGAEPSLVPAHAALFGLAKVIWQEDPEITCRCLDVGTATSAEAVVAEIRADDPTGMVALRDGKRFVAELTVADLGVVESTREDDGPLQRDGAVLITGGLGGLGIETARYLSAVRPAAGIALVGRSSVPPPKEWPELRDKTGTKQAGQIRALAEIIESGTPVRWYQGDVADLDDMTRIVRAIREDLGRIVGVVHAAGTAGDGFILRKPEDVFRATLAPKVTGAMVLDAVTSDDPPEVMVMFSSTTALFGAAGQSDYTAANLYLDAFTHWRNHQGRRTVTVNWTDWLDTGMAADHNVQRDQGFFRSITIDDAIGCLDAILRAGHPQVIVGEINHAMLGALDPTVLNGLMARAPVRLSEPIRRALTWSPQRTQKVVDHTAAVEVTLTGRADDGYGELERQLARIWAAELGRTEINVRATLFDLGGDSLIALRLANTIQQVWEHKVTMAEIFAHPTVAELAVRLGEAEEDAPVAAAAEAQADDTGWFELWNVQRGMWLQHQLEENRAELNLPVWQEVHFEVDADALREAVDLLVERHRALRLVFTDTPVGPRQSVLAQHSVEIPLVDLTDAAEPAEDLRRLIRADNLLAFGELSVPPLRVKLYRLGAEHYCLYLNVHHIISDGTSMGILLRELQTVYEAIATRQQPELQPLATTYDEYVRTRCHWLNSQESSEMARFWRDELAWPVPRLRLGDYEGPAADVPNESVEFRIEPELTAALTETAKSLDVTVHILLLAAYFAVLHDLTADEDIVVGVPFSGRDTKELENLVGLFINALSVRLRLSGTDTFADLVAMTRRKSLQAYANGRYPCTDLVERLKAEHPELSAIFTTAFQFTDFLPPADQTAQLDICLNGRRREDEIELRFSYNPRRLTRSEVVDIQVSLLALLAEVRQDTTVTLSALAGPMKQARQRATQAPGRRSRLQSLITDNRGR